MEIVLIAQLFLSDFVYVSKSPKNYRIIFRYVI